MKRKTKPKRKVREVRMNNKSNQNKFKKNFLMRKKKDKTGTKPMQSFHLLVISFTTSQMVFP